MEKSKILLVSDLHLGMENNNFLISGEERLTTFRNVIELAKKHDILLIAGDLIHNEYIDLSYYEVIKKEFCSLLDEGKEIFYAPGSGELTGNGSLNPLVEDIGVTYIFSDKNKSRFYKSSAGELFIYGLQNINVSNKCDVVRVEPGGFHIGLFYADFNPQITGLPETGCIKKEDMKKMNLDFFALGKSHFFRMFRSSNRILGVYPGSAEPCSIDEYGERYAVSMEIEGNELVCVKRIAINTVKILLDEIDCGAIENESELADRIKFSFPEGSLVNIHLTGERDFLIEGNLGTALSGYFRNLKVTDRSVPTLKVMMEENISPDSLNGIFYRLLKEEMDSGMMNKLNSRLLADIIIQGYGKRKQAGDVICDF